MKEMVGGCCVCSDERGWPENPLVYCDGQNCTVAVHQACYGIVTVPTGPWFCRKCESQERSTRVRCELCPSRDGALKKTDNQGWAHVVCALYIPEVRFGNVTTMEPIILQLIPQERYAKTCYICQEIGKPSRATVGACMQCNKSNCKQQFHVTCAQSLGLLCEEAGNYLDNVKYCGYCQHHYSKLKKGGNVKTIPPYKPITHGTSSDSASSPEKEIEPTATATSSSTSATSIKITTNVNQSSAAQSSAKQRKSNVSSKQSISSSSTSGASTLSSSSTTATHGVTGGNGNASTSLANNSVGGNSMPPTNPGSGNAIGSGAGTSSTSTSKSSSSSSSSYKDKDKHSKSVAKVSSSSKDKESSSSSSSSSRDSRDKSSKSSKSKESSNSAVVPTMPNAMSTASTPTTASDFNTIAGAQSSTNTSTSSSGSASSLNQPKDLTKSHQQQPNNQATNFGIASDHHAPNTAGAFSNIHNEAITSAPTSTAGTTLATSSSSSNKNPNNSNNSAAKKRKTDSKSSLNEESNSSFKDALKDVSATMTSVPQTDFEKEIEKTNKKQKTEVSVPSHHPAATDSSPQHGNGNSGSTSSIPVPATIVPTSSIATAASTSHRHSLSDVSKPPTSFNLTNNSCNSIISSSLQPNATSSHSSKSGLSSMPSSSAKEHHRPDDRYAPPSGMGAATNLTVSQQGPVSGMSTPNAITSSAPSLYVSVPLSTANVPGINLLSTGIVNNPDPQSVSSVQSVRNTSQQQQSSTSVLGNLTPMNPAGAPLNLGSNGGAGCHTSMERQSPRVHHSDSSSGNFGQLASNMQSPSPMHGVIHQSGKSPTPSMVSSSNLTATTTESGNLKISCEKPQLRIAQLQEQEAAPVRRSRTPDSGIFSSSPFHSSNISSHSTSSTSLNISSGGGGGGNGSGGLKFTYEAQSGNIATSVTPPISVAPTVDVSSLPLATSIKESPPSSPNSEASSVRKRGRKMKDAIGGGNVNSNPAAVNDIKDVKVFQNGGNPVTTTASGLPQAAHMLGNQINPNSNVARKLSDQLHMEIQDHSIYTPEAVTPQFIGVPFPGKTRATSGTPTTTGATTPVPQGAGAGGATNSFASMFGSNVNGNLTIPQSLEQLLERQWEQGSQFLMEQAQHFDIASLLSCLHQLQNENSRLEEHVTSLIARRDHLLAVNARLAIPLTSNATQSQGK